MRNDFLIFVGPMFGGKTTRLLSAIDRYRYQGRKIFCFKPEVDQRYSKSEIVTHTGGIQQAYRIKDAKDIKDHLISWGLKPGTEDIVVLPSESEYLKKLREVMNPGARIAVIDFKMDGPIGPPKEGRISPDQVKTELKNAGFSLKQEYDFLPNQYFLIFQ